VPHVVVLSSVGADLAEGTGPVRWLHHLEQRLTEKRHLADQARYWRPWIVTVM
jgi:hypothetical protein